MSKKAGDILRLSVNEALVSHFNIADRSEKFTRLHESLS